MGDSTRVTHRQLASSPVARAAAAVIAMTGVVLLLAACGGSRTATGASTAGSASARGSTEPESASVQMLPFANCMRSNGVPSFPDPNNTGKFPDAHALGVSSPLFQAALTKCKQRLPNGGIAPNQTQLHQQETALIPFAKCMRSHGVSDWPDPSIYTNTDGETAVVFNLIGTSLDGSGFDAAPVQAKSNTCQHLLPPSNGGPPYRIVR